MKPRSRLVLVIGFAVCSAAAFVSFRGPVEKDPFVNLFSVTWQEDWRERHVIGDVTNYQAPFDVRDFPGVSWGANSIHFTTSLPLEDDLVGRPVDDRFVLQCYQQLLLAVSEVIEEMPETNMPSEIFEAAMDEVANQTRYPDGADQAYIRQCYGSFRPRDPEAYKQGQILHGSKGELLLDQCADAIQKRFRGVGDVEYDAGANKFYLLRVASVDGPSGTALGALCRETTHPSGIFHVYAWYLPRRL